MSSVRSRLAALSYDYFKIFGLGFYFPKTDGGVTAEGAPRLPYSKYLSNTSLSSGGDESQLNHNQRQMIYTLLLSARINEQNETPQLWAIVDSRRFRKPRSMVQYLCLLASRGVLGKSACKLEMYEGRYEDIDFSQQPIKLLSNKKEGTNKLEHIVVYPNGNQQKLGRFLNHWQLFIKELGKQ